MKISRIARAINDIDDELLIDAERSSASARGARLIKWVSVAACFAVLLTVLALVSPSLFDSEEIPVDTDIGAQETNPAVYTERYVYRASDSFYSSYIGGKVIEEEKLGQKIDSVTVTAGWENGSGERLTEERLRAEVYAIEGVPKETAVALRFLDKGEALTLTHYYFFLNPEADLTELQEYVIGAITPTEGEYGEETSPDDVVSDETVQYFTEPRVE